LNADMPQFDAFMSSPWLVWVVVVVAVAGLAHGTLGFGFPLISMPMIALVTDVQTAVLVSLLPNLAVNLVSVLRGGRWRDSLALHWPVAVYVVVGTVLGTRMLLWADPEPLRLLLALMIVAYLLQSPLRHVHAAWLSRHPRLCAALFGLSAGVLSGTVNVAVPPLVIYFMALGLDALAMTQILNLCFLAGRLTQTMTLGLAHQIDASSLVATVPLAVLSLAALWIGLRLQRRIDPAVFRGLLSKTLWVMAAVLAVQVVRHYAV
jgi:uncharacterized membrane protein YfcA